LWFVVIISPKLICWHFFPQVNVGMGLQIGRKAWEKNLRLKKEDSKFLKDCAGHIWGRDALKVRTGNRKSGDKKPCTPKKVDLLHGI